MSSGSMAQVEEASGPPTQHPTQNREKEHSLVNSNSNKTQAYVQWSNSPS